MTPAKKIFLTALFFLTPGFLFSQEIITDRPDKSESVETVGKNKLQIETGIEYSLFKTELDAFVPGTLSIRIFTLPTTLVRFGVLKNLELRLGFDFDFANSSLDYPLQPGLSNSQTTSLTLNPPTLGAKFEVAKGKGVVPDFSVLGTVKIPNVGDEVKQVKYFTPEFVLLFSNEINEKIGIGYNIGVEWSDDLEEKNYFYSVSTGYSITPRLGTFFEFYGDLKTDIKNSSQNIDGGFSYLIKNNLQVDIYGGLGLTEEANNFILGTGIAYKF
ncbi:MAG: transporter [Ignavibacteria bacterium]|nr:transporter [Ignavibacteria bacterium]